MWFYDIIMTILLTIDIQNYPAQKNLGNLCIFASFKRLHS
jgi:hypothetical protein